MVGLDEDRHDELVLVVDDDAAGRRLLAKILDRNGYPCITAGNIAEARQRGYSRLSLETGSGPAFETPIFYYRPYPGNPIAEDARQRGYLFPRGLAAWADFDYVGGREDLVSTLTVLAADAVSKKVATLGGRG